MFDFKEFRNLISIFSNVDPKLVNINHWAHITECGTVGCIMGHYAIQTKKINVDHCKIGTYILWHYGLECSKIFFGISMAESLLLFSANNYEGNEQYDKEFMLKRLRRFYTYKVMEYHRLLPKKEIVRELELV